MFDKYFNGFSSDNPIYYRMSLQQVESYIKEYHHLPRIPSRKEIYNDKAINIQGMQMITLEKVEELYLYTIEQQKTIDKLQKELEEIKAILNKGN